MTDAEFIAEYLKLIIMQYAGLPKAVADITVKVSSYSKIYSVINDFLTEIDVDTAIGEQLNLIGRIVGVRNAALTEAQLRFFIRAKILKNVASAKMSTNESVSLLDSYIFLLQGAGYVVDTQKMKLVVYVDTSIVSETDLILINGADLFVLPMAVGISFVYINLTTTFGFGENPLCVSFGNGTFANALEI
jgi:hypothetical protein